MSKAASNTRVEYLYRDASNYKFRGEFVVAGTLTREDVEPHLFDRGWFVPTQIGLPHLLAMPVNEDDHMLHEFEDFVPTSHDETICSAAELVGRLSTASRSGWFSGLV
jgi:hypothetical protein